MPPTRRRLLLAALAIGLAPGATAAQQPTRIVGRVTSEAGAPIAAATVAIQSLGLGAATDENGSFALTVPADRARGQTVAVLVRAIGYRSDTAQVTLAPGEVQQNFSLATNPLRLGEVVITGAGTTSEVQKLGSVRENVDSSLLRRANEPNVVTALAAKAPNVDVVSSAGDPGASSSIRIRGANTLGGTGEPLFIVDGTPIDNSTFTTSTLDPSTSGGQGGTFSPNRASDINPDDIESIEILKGAAAGAIYGARAGQGVVLITTKRGRAGATTYSLRSTLSSNDVNRFPALQRQYGQGIDGLPDECALTPTNLDCEAILRSWGPRLDRESYVQGIQDAMADCDAACANARFDELFPNGIRTFDHSRDVFRTGLTSDNTLSVAGGNDRTSFFVSGSYLNQRGTFVGPNNDYTRTSVRLKASQRVSNKFTVGGNVAYVQANGDFLQKGSNFSGMTLGAWRSPPEFNNQPYLDPITGLHRAFGFPHPSNASVGVARGYDNPFFTANVPISTSNTDRVFGNVTLDYVPLSWLKFAYTLGIDHSGDERVQGQPQTSSNTPDPLGQVIRLDITNTQIDHNLVATANYSLTPNFGGTVSLGQNLNARDARQLGIVGNRLLAPQPYSLANTETQSPPLDFQTKVRLEGYFGQATFDMYDQLYLRGGLRYDGSSTFAASERRNWFPSASAAWQFTNLTGDLNGWLPFGKLRLAYGEVGTEPLPYLRSFTFIGGAPIVDSYGMSLAAGQGGFGGLYSDSVRAATQLKPERTRETEVGIDVGLLRNLADLSFTYFKRNSKDVILQVPIPASSGYRLVASNGAEITNFGTEWSLNVRPITRPSFAWELGFQVGTLRNTVNRLAGADFVNYGGNGSFGISVAQPGYGVGEFRDYDFVRCGRGIILDDGSPEGFDVDAACGAEGVSQGALYIDDGTFSASGAGYPIGDFSQSRPMGNPNPKWTGNVRNTFRFGKFNVSGLVDIRRGGVVYNGTRGALNTIGTSAETARRGETVVFGRDIFKGPVAGPGANTETELSESWFLNDGGAFNGPGQPYYEDGSFVKLREISVGYTFTGGVVNRTLGLGSIDLRVAGRNLGVWTDYRGADPETNLAGAETGARGVDWFNNPQTRSYVLTLTLNR